MALLKANLSLSGAGLMTTPLNLTVSASINADSGSLIKGKVLGVAAGSDATVIYKPSDKLDSAYVYVRNVDREREHFIYIYADTGADNPVVMKIAGGEFAFFPAKSDVSLKAYGTSVDQIIEYGVFGLDSSAVRLS
jgi:hypothetical protein